MPIASLDELRTAVRRPAAVGNALIDRRSADPLGSWLGKVTAIGRGESWPTHEGRPMVGVAQINLTRSLYVPATLAELAMITIFLAEGDGWFINPDLRPNGDGWAVRTYRAIDDLEPVEGLMFDGIHPRQIEWHAVDDYPGWDDLITAIGYDEVSALLAGREPADVIGFPAEGPKLGGWPSTIQGELMWGPWGQHPAAPAYCIQIDGDRATSLVPLGSGVLYLGLGSVDGQPMWAATTQFP